MLFTLSAAARFLDIDRRTVQRYVQRFPEIIDGKKVEMVLLQRRSDQCKATEGRGFPIGRKRGIRLPLAGGSQEAPGDHSANFSAALCNHFARNRRNDRRRAAETITDEVSGPIPFRECRESSGAGGQAQGGRLSRFDKGKIEANFSRGLFAVVVEQMPVNLADKNPAVLVSKPCGDGHKVQPRHDAE